MIIIILDSSGLLTIYVQTEDIKKDFFCLLYSAASSWHGLRQRKKGLGSFSCFTFFPEQLSFKQEHLDFGATQQDLKFNCTL